MKFKGYSRHRNGGDRLVLDHRRVRAVGEGEEAGRGPQADRASARGLLQERSGELKAEVAKAPGYAVFSTFGMSFLIGGTGGKGIAVDNKTKKVTYMDLAGASAGLTIGAQEARYLYVFKDTASLQRFIDSGWDAGAELAAGAGAGEKSGTAQAGTFTGGRVYMLTKAGFQAAAAVGGTKVWKDKELN